MAESLIFCDLDDYQIKAQEWERLMLYNTILETIYSKILDSAFILLFDEEMKTASIGNPDNIMRCSKSFFSHPF